MTLLQIKMMLHYYCIAAPYAEHDPRHANSIAVAEQRRALCSHGMLLEMPTEAAKYGVTEKGRAYVNALQRLPMPVSQWIIPGHEALTTG